MGLRVPWRGALDRTADHNRRPGVHRQPARKVYSLDASSGCTYWEYDAGKPVRSAVVVGPSAGGWAADSGDLAAMCIRSTP